MDTDDWPAGADATRRVLTAAAATEDAPSIWADAAVMTEESAVTPDAAPITAAAAREAEADAATED